MPLSAWLLLLLLLLITRSDVTPSATTATTKKLGKYTQGDNDVISFRIYARPVGFRRHLVGKTLINVCYCDIT